MSVIEAFAVGGMGNTFALALAIVAALDVSGSVVVSFSNRASSSDEQGPRPSPSLSGPIASISVRSDPPGNGNRTDRRQDDGREPVGDDEPNREFVGHPQVRRDEDERDGENGPDGPSSLDILVHVRRSRTGPINHRRIRAP